MSRDFDAIVNDRRFLPFRGWHDDYKNKRGAEYLPAVQQVRAEFLALAEAIAAHGLKHKCLQLGLGHAGASHLLFRALFEKVWTVEIETVLIQRFLDRFPDERHFIAGSTRNPVVAQVIARNAPFDLLFIDASHLYDDVAADYHIYSPMVAPGGLVVFHDADNSGPGVEVRQFLAGFTKIAMAGSGIGTAWIVKE